MAAQPNRPIKLELTIQGEDTAILAGLEALLQLNLITQEQVQYLCQKHFTCVAPEPQPNPLLQPAPQRESRVSAAASTGRSTPPTPAAPGFVAQRLQALMAEISVLWLLLLGVFLVVVSSAVLAAREWQNFPPAGQYGILFAYTLAFWGAATWTSRRSNLQLTAQMLEVTTLLIIPVNFWMMDGFRLWGSAMGWAIGAISSFVLSGIMVLLLRSPSQTPLLILLNSLGLSWVHWGWSLSGLPLVATYLGTIGTAVTVFCQVEAAPAEPHASSPSTLRLGTISIAFATVLLLSRALFVAQVPLNQLGLAFGMCGWFLSWLARSQTQRRWWAWTGTGLLLAGWGLSVNDDPPWQAIVVSGLALWLLVDRLRQTWQPLYLTGFLLVGLQTYVLCGQLIPAPIRQTIVDTLGQWIGPNGMPDVLLGIFVFPYVGLMLGMAQWFRRQDQARLVKQTEWFALILGGGLTWGSSFNSGVLAINLSLSAITLALVVWKRANADSSLIFLTHAVGLSAIAAWVQWGYPDLDWTIRAVLLLTVALLEWGFAAIGRWTLWRQSAWYFGLGLAAISYQFLFNALIAGSDWGLIGLAAPIALTVLTYHSRFPPRTAAAWCSTVFLLPLQILALPTTPNLRILSLGAATLLMLLNTRYLQNLLAAVITVGFGLGFSGYIVGEILSDRGWLKLATFWFLISGFVVLLWLLWAGLRRWETRLSQVYQNAVDGWAIVVGAITLQSATAYSLFHFFSASSVEALGPWHVSAIGLLTVAIALRTLLQPADLGFFGWAWGVEILIYLGGSFTGRSWEQLALANLALGFLCQWAGDGWVRRVEGRTYRLSWHVIPLAYAALAFLFQHFDFTATSGCYTLGLAIVGIGVGRRAPAQPLTYLSLLTASVGAYELLIYQLLQTKGGSAGDGIVLLAGLATVIALAYLGLSRWLSPYLRLGDRDVQAMGHLHWSFSTLLLVFAVMSPLSLTGSYLWAAMMAVTAAYALQVGRTAVTSAQATWTYAGIAELVVAIGACLYLWVPDQALLLQWSGAIASFLAYGMYLLPWGRWGWPASPWRRSAVTLPLLITLFFLTQSNILSLLVVAAFYAWIARLSGRIRLSYLGVLIAVYASFRLLVQYQLTGPLWGNAIVGVALLFVAQVDPYLTTQPAREQRHWLRCLATGLIAAAALYQSDRADITPATLGLALGTIGLAIGLGVAGLVLRVRAFLYLGTLLFMLKVLRLVWLLVGMYSFLFWAIGAVLGLIFMLIAANFEARRSQVSALVQSWATELSQWE